MTKVQEVMKDVPSDDVIESVGTLFAKNSMGVFDFLISGWLRRFSSSSFATTVRMISVLSTTKIIAWTSR
jgi:hypothetical protein